jgi:hypothetical protein
MSDTLGISLLYYNAMGDDCYNFPSLVAKHLTFGCAGSIIGRLFSEKFVAPIAAGEHYSVRGGISQLLILSIDFSLYAYQRDLSWKETP